MATIGTAATSAVQGLTVSPPPAERSSSVSLMMTEVRMPTSDSEYHALVKAIPHLPVAAAPPADPTELARHFEFLAATLPCRAVDDDTGRKRFSVYAKMLSGYSNDALAFMARTACERLNWFPTPHQCIEIIAEYVAPPAPRALAERYCLDYQHNRMTAFLDALRDGTATQDAVDAVKERWRMIAAERGYLRRLDDGAYVIRPRPFIEDVE